MRPPGHDGGGVLPPGLAGGASAALLLAALAFHVAFIARSSFGLEGKLAFSLFDDAMVSLTYARNLAEGHGLVWMPGESPVEGYTNLLWTLLLVIPHAIGLPERLVCLPVMGFGALLLAITSLLAMQIARRLSRSQFAPPLALAASAFCYPLVFWTLRGLEVGLLACFVTGATLLAFRLAERPSLRDRWLLAALGAGAVLARTDAVVWVTPVVVFLVSSARTRRDAIVAASATAVALAGHTAFRLTYYGDALPNTYYLKMTGHFLSDRLGRGLDSLWSLVAGSLWAPTALVLALLAIRIASLEREQRLLVGVVLAALVYSVYVGGDVWEWAGFANRYVSVALPPMFVLAVLGIEALLDAPARRAVWGFGVAGAFAGVALWRMRSVWNADPAWQAQAGLLLVGLTLVGRQARLARSAATRSLIVASAALLMVVLANAAALERWLEDGGLHVRLDASMVKKALAIRAATPLEARIAVVWAGAIPYFSRRPAIDLLGKSDPIIARARARVFFDPGHDKWDYEYSVGRLRPDVVAQVWWFRAKERRRFEEWGYEAVGEYWVRADANVDRERLLASE